MNHPSDTPFNAGPEGAALGCVAVPIVADDINTTLGEVFALWVDPRFLPVLAADTPRPHLMIVVNQASDGQLAEIQALFKGFPALSTVFAGCSAHSAELAGERDLYAPDGGAEGPAFGRKAGPNFLFQRLIELARGHNESSESSGQGGFTLQLELDCLPIGPGWVEAVGAVIAEHPSAWVIGSHYAGAGLLGPDAKSHLNGNALYHTGSPGFRTFFDDIWMPRLLYQIKARPDLAYDWWWSVERHEADARANNQSWQLFQTYDSFFQADPYIVNLAVPAAEVQAYAEVFDRFAGLGRAPVFLHGPAMNRVRQVLLEHMQSDIFTALARLDPPRSDIIQTRKMGRTRARPSAAQPKALSPDQLLLQAAAELLQGSGGAGAQTDDQLAAIRRARDVLAADHPARVHFDRVRAHVGLADE